jgi:hypothetical protein
MRVPEPMQHRLSPQRRLYRIGKDGTKEKGVTKIVEDNWVCFWIKIDGSIEDSKET